MKTNESIHIRQDLLFVTRFLPDENGTLRENHCEYNKDFSEVRHNRGFFGENKGDWESVSESEQIQLKENFKDLGRKVRVNLEPDPKTNRKTYKGWNEDVGNMVNNKTGTIQKIFFRPKDRMRIKGDWCCLVIFDEPILPNKLYRTAVDVEGYHFKMSEIIFL